MTHEPKASLIDRIAFACVGGAVGGVFGFFLTLVVLLATGQFCANLVGVAAASFAVLSFFSGNFAAEAILALLHFLWGLVHGVAAQEPPPREEHAQGHLRAMALFGFGAGFTLLLWSWL